MLRVEPDAQTIRRERLYRAFGMTDDEFERASELLGRDPNYAETGIFSVMWSEHCSYKSSRKVLREFPNSGPQVLQGPGENAGAVAIGDDLAAVFKIESHNHPTAVEPYQGAATGVGGIVRDIFTMGARPIALLNSLRFGPLSQARNRYLFGHAVAGIGDYGNCIGVPTVGGEVVFDDRYSANPLVNAMCVGIIAADAIARGQAHGVGNPVLVVGARTGRDGIHGATFASVEDPDSRERSAVQVGDPFMEKLLIEACLDLLETGAVVGIQDMGAAGLTSSSAEMAARAGSGLELDVSQVAVRETGMSAYEIMLSESQERMLVVMERGKEQVAERIFAHYGLEATTVGRVTDDGMLRIRMGERVEAEIPVRALVDDTPVRDLPAERPDYLDALRPGREAAVRLARLLELEHPAAVPGAGADITGELERVLAQPTVASKAWVYRQYDSMVRTETLVRPGADAAVVGVPGTSRALALATDGNGRRVYLDPLEGGRYVLAEAARNVVCVGARPLAVTDCLNYGNPDKPGVFYQLQESVRGLAQACTAFATPVVSGNVSLYNETRGVDIFPTPVIGMVGLLDDASRVLASALALAGDALYLIGQPGALGWDALGASEYLALRLPQEALAYRPSAVDLAAADAVHRACLAAAAEQLVVAAHDVADGGLLTTLAEMAFGTGFGLKGEIPVGELLPAAPADALAAALVCGFGEWASGIVVEVRPAHEAQLLALCAAHGAPVSRLCEVDDSARLRLRVGGAHVDATVAQLEAQWKGAIPAWME